MTAIVDYEGQVADLLHDATHVVWTTAQLDRYINEARRQVAMDTMCIRSLQSIYIMPGVESYAYGTVTGAAIAAGGTGYTSAPAVVFTGGGGTGVAATAGVSGGAVTSITFTSSGSGYTTVPTIGFTGGGGSGAVAVAAIVSDLTLDILQINAIWGAQRYPLQWRPWTVFSTQFRQMTTQQQRPIAWSFYGPRGFYVNLPDQVYQMEVDSAALPFDLTGATADPIPLQVQDPIKFYAAYLAKFYLQQFGEAETFRAQYNRRLGECITSYNRRIPNPMEAAQ